jgi:proteasome lid subunit RPN8/RPN11
MGLYEAALASGRPFSMYLSGRSERVIRFQAVKEAPRRLEVMGFLLGEVRTWGGTVFSTVRDVVTTDLENTHSNVRFDHSALPRLFHDMDGSGFDYIIVGWYHSHPGHTCFLSKTDLRTQRSMFSQPYHTALVIDPLNEDIKAFRLSGKGYEEVPFAVTDAIASTRIVTGRTRRLRSENP